MTPDKKRLGLTFENFFEEEREKAKSYECVACKMVFSDNYELECLHCICTNCINDYEKCPIDNTDIIGHFNAYNDSYIGNVLLDELNVYCIFKEKGCLWTGKCEEFYSTHLKECQFNYEEGNVKINNFQENYINKNENDLNKIMEDENIEENINYNEERIPNKKILNRKRKLSKGKINDEKIDEDDNSRKKEKAKDNNRLDLIESNFSLFQQKNININNNIIFPLNNVIDNFNDNKNNNINDPGLILEKYFYENYNNVIEINSNFTNNIFPYHYYFTEPLDDTFNCKIEVLSREININGEISFGLTNVNNNDYKEIITTKNNLFIFVKGDIIKIIFDSNIFYITNENGKYNKKINFEKNDNIRCYPTIILNNQRDILKVSHN